MVSLAACGVGGRPAELVACYSGAECDRDPSVPSDEPCTPTELRASGMLCVELLSIEGVAVHAESLLVVGETVAGMTAFHWAVTR